MLGEVLRKECGVIGHRIRQVFPEEGFDDALPFQLALPRDFSQVKLKGLVPLETEARYVGLDVIELGVHGGEVFRDFFKRAVLLKRALPDQVGGALVQPVDTVLLLSRASEANEAAVRVPNPKRVRGDVLKLVRRLGDGQLACRSGDHGWSLSSLAPRGRISGGRLPFVVIESSPGRGQKEKAPQGAVSWSGRRDSNPRHSAWEADTLPTELHPRRA